MRILHVTDGIPPVTLGGTGRIVTEIARGQAAAGHDVGILTSAPAGTLPERIGDVRIFRIEPGSERFAHWRCVFSRSRERNVLTHIRNFRPDIVHAHTVSRQMGYRWMPKLGAAKWILTCHDVSHVAYGKVTGGEKNLWLTEMRRHRWTWNPFRHRMIRYFIASAHRIIAVSDALREYLISRGFATNITTIHNGIDLDFWAADTTKEAARAKLKLPTEGFFFLLAGRMGVDKGSTLIAATLPNNAHLILAGDRFSDEFAPVRDRLHTFHHQSAEQMKLHYSAADVILVPSRCLDCFPTVCLEAMAMKRPVIATSWGGAQEAVTEGVTGWILDPLNPDAWREKMLWCMSHPEKIAEAGKAGQERAHALFGSALMLKKLDAMYQ